MTYFSFKMHQAWTPKIVHFKKTKLHVYLLVEGKRKRGTLISTKAVLYGMMEFVHQQLQSCLTGKVNAILDTNQTYDPSVNFGKNKN